MKILLIDNYDSFTYNLVHQIESISNIRPDVYRNDEISLEKINSYDVIFLSPGPGLPNESGLLLDIIKEHKNKKPIFGVCLGLQAIVENFGGKLKNLDAVFHGVATEMKISKKNHFLFKNIPKKFKAGRYHSWIADKKHLPNCLDIICEDEEGEIMAISHKEYPIYAVQFHPESILSKPIGDILIKNFINSI